MHTEVVNIVLVHELNAYELYHIEKFARNLTLVNKYYHI